MKTVKFEGKTFYQFDITAFGKKEKVICVPRQYQNETLAIEVLSYEKDYDDWGTYGILTTNLDDYRQSDTRAFVKTYSENEGWATKLLNMIGAKKTRISATNGWVDFPLYEFDLSKIVKED
jgi:hypothetical protein